LERLRAALFALLALSAVIGVLIAAFLLGSVIAVVLLLVVFFATIGWLVFRLWRHITHDERRVS
jgi:hypothetical protein